MGKRATLSFPPCPIFPQGMFAGQGSAISASMLGCLTGGGSPGKRLPVFYGPRTGERVREKDSERKGAEKWVRVGESALRVPPPSPKRRFQPRSWREAPECRHWAKDAEMHPSVASPGKLSPRLQFPSETAVCCLYTRSVVSEGTCPLWSLQGRAFIPAYPWP